MSNIEVLGQDDLKDRFLNGDIVFKITKKDVESLEEDTNKDPNPPDQKPYGIIQTSESYTKRRNTHIYTPLLYMCDFPTHLAYLYGCLNKEYKKPHDYIYTFWWRELNTKEWNEWFISYPYIEN